MRKLLIVVLLLLALGAPSAQGAFAPPPVGRYDCVIGANSILFGTLVIKSGKRYAHRGTRGTFRTPAAKRLRFVKGGLGGMRGRWYRSSTGRYEIALRNPRDDFESIYCTRA